MSRASPDLTTAVLDRIRADAPRKVWTSGDFGDLASRHAVDKTLQRLTKAEGSGLIDRGLHDQPVFNKLILKTNPPDPRPVIHAIGRRDRTRERSRGRQYGMCSEKDLPTCRGVIDSLAFFETESRS